MMSNRSSSSDSEDVADEQHIELQQISQSQSEVVAEVQEERKDSSRSSEQRVSHALSNSDMEENDDSKEYDEERPIFEHDPGDFQGVLARALDLCNGVTEADALTWQCLNTAYFMQTLNA